MITEKFTTTIDNVGTSFKEATISDTYKSFFIIRARAEILSGSGSQVALSVREKSEPTNTSDVALEYSLTTNPLDSKEHIFFEAQDLNSQNNELGNVYIAVKCDSGSDSQVRITIDYTKIL